jgi:hypothetical protein
MNLKEHIVVASDPGQLLITIQLTLKRPSSGEVYTHLQTPLDPGQLLIIVQLQHTIS